MRKRAQQALSRAAAGVVGSMWAKVRRGQRPALAVAPMALEMLETRQLLSVPAAPTSLAAIPFWPGSLMVNWTDNATDETGFTIQAATDPSFTYDVATTSVAANTPVAMIGNLIGGASYYVRVYATNGDGNSAYSNTSLSGRLVIAGPDPATPGTLTATPVSSTHINLAWADTSQAYNQETSFMIERATDSAFTQGYARFGAPQDATSYQDTTVAAGTTYYYRVCSVTYFGWSADSNVASATAQGSSTTTLLLTGDTTVSAGSVYTLTLGSVADAAGYVINWDDGATTTLSEEDLNQQDRQVSHVYQYNPGTHITVDIVKAGETLVAAAAKTIEVTATPMAHMVAGSTLTPAGLAIQRLVSLNGVVYFEADDGANGYQLWRLDPTGIAAPVAGVGSIMQGGLTATSDSVYFTTYDDTLGTLLWKLQGTNSPVQISGAAGLWPYSLTPVGDTLYFCGSDGDGSGLWEVDATGAVTKVSGWTGIWASYLTAVGTTLYFCDPYSSPGSTSLWKVEQGSSAEEVCELDLGMSGLNGMGEAGGTLYLFSQRFGQDRPLLLGDGENSSANVSSGGDSLLWKLDDGDVVPISGIASGDYLYYSITRAVQAGDSVYFAGSYGGGSDYSLWKLDESGTLVSLPDVGSLYSDSMVAIGDQVFFIGQDAQSGQELWKTDGTPAGTVRVMDILPGSGSGLDSDYGWGHPLFPATTATGTPELYFAANDGVHGRALWHLDSPTASIVPAAVDEGGNVQLSATATGGGQLAYAWDLDGDGVFGETGTAAGRGDETVPNPTFSAAGLNGPSAYPIHLRVTDALGLATIVAGTVTIDGPVLITGGPSADAGFPYTIGIVWGDTPADTSWQVDWGDGSTTRIYGQPTNLTHAFTSGGTSSQIQVTGLVPDTTIIDSNTLTVDIASTPNGIDLSGDSTVAKGSTAVVDFTTLDPSATVDSWLVTWGDGTTSTVDGDKNYATHVYNHPSAGFSVMVAAVSGGTNITSDPHSIEVPDAPPVFDIEGPSQSYSGKSYNLVFSATGPGATTIKSWSIDWGDGGAPEVIITGNPSQITHPYETAGQYTISLSATNDDGTYSCPTQLAVQVRPWANDQLFEVTDETTPGQIPLVAGQTVALVHPPQLGTVQLNSDGSFTYTRGAGHRGLDSFTYEVTDAGQVSNVGTVQLELLHMMLPVPSIGIPPTSWSVNGFGVITPYRTNDEWGWNQLLQQWGWDWQYNWDISPEFDSRTFNCYALPPDVAAKYQFNVGRSYTNGGSGTLLFNADGSYTYSAGLGTYGETIECTISDDADTGLPFYVNATVDRMANADSGTYGDSFLVYNSPYTFLPPGSTAIVGTLMPVQMYGQQLLLYQPPEGYSGFDFITQPDYKAGQSFEDSFPLPGTADYALYMAYYTKHGFTVNILEQHEDHLWVSITYPQTDTLQYYIPAVPPDVPGLSSDNKSDMVLQNGGLKVDLGQSVIVPSIVSGLPPDGPQTDFRQSYTSAAVNLDDHARVEIITSPQHGTLVNTDGTEYIYTPNTDYIGNDYVIYKVYDLDDDGNDTGLRGTFRYEFDVTPSGPGLVVDTANESGFDDPLPLSSLAKDAIEDDSAKPGKIIAVNDDDTDGDGVIDYADFDGIQGEQFTPLVWDYLPDGSCLDSQATLTFDYSALLPTSIHQATDGTFSLDSNAGSLRIWTKDGSAARSGASVADGGDLILPGEAYSAGQLGVVPGQPLRLWAEAIKPSATLGDQQISVSFDPDGTDNPGLLAKDAVRMTAYGFSLQIDSNNDGQIDATDDAIKNAPSKPGKILFVDNGDSDQDGIPDFADFDNQVVEGGQVQRFVPVMVTLPDGISAEAARIRFHYDASDPVAALYSDDDSYEVQAGTLRLWRKDADMVRLAQDIASGGDFVNSGVGYTASTLGFSATCRERTFWLEAVDARANAEVSTVTVSVDPLGTEAYSLDDTVTCSPVDLQLMEVAQNGDLTVADGIDLSSPIPDVSIATVELDNVRLSSDEEHILADIHLVGIVKSSFCDQINDLSGSIGWLHWSLNGVSGGDFTIEFVKELKFKSYARPYPYDGEFDVVLSGVEVTPDCNTLTVEATDPSTGATGAADGDFQIIATPPPADVLQLESRVTFAQSPSPNQVDELLFRAYFHPGSGGTGVLTMTETAVDSGVFVDVNDDSTVLTIETFPTAMPDGGAEITAVFNSDTWTVYDVSLHLTTLINGNLTFDGTGEYEVPPDPTLPWYAGYDVEADPDVVLTSTGGGDWQSYVMRLIGPEVAMTQMSSVQIGGVERGLIKRGNGSVVVASTPPAAAKPEPLPVSFMGRALQQFQQHVETLPEYSTGVAVGFGEGISGLVSGIYDLGLAASKYLTPAAAFYGPKLAFKLLNGGQLDDQEAFVVNAGKGIAALGALLYKLSVESVDEQVKAFTALATRDAALLGAVGDVWSQRLAWSADLFAELAKRFNGMAPYDQGKLMGRVTFEVMALVVPVEEVTGLTKLKFLAKLKNVDLFKSGKPLEALTALGDAEQAETRLGRLNLLLKGIEDAGRTDETLASLYLYLREMNPAMKPLDVWKLTRQTSNVSSDAALANGLQMVFHDIYAGLPAGEITEETLAQLPKVSDLADIVKPKFLHSHHTVPVGIQRRLGIPEAEWDTCPAYALCEADHLTGETAFHRILNGLLDPRKRYDDFEVPEILAKLEEAYTDFGTPEIWRVVKQWLKTKGIQ